MQVPFIIFAKIPLSSGSSKIVFCVEQNKLFEFNLVKYSPTQFAQQNNLLRHDKFDWHVNKNKPICYTFEKEGIKTEEELPLFLNDLEKKYDVQWAIFPVTIKKLANGTHRNLVQLAVQYISYGMIDESVIAADYDEGFLKDLMDKA